MKRLNLPYAEAVFDISYFRKHPEPFYVLAKELYPGKFYPTVSHAFIALLARKGLLQLLFTQNIDCLERRAGVPPEKIIEAHGSFATQRCIECQKEYPDDKTKEHVFKGEVPHCDSCNGLVKPDIVFFGEALPAVFGQNAHQTALADLVLIIGTSLTVYPFAGVPEMASPGKPRVLFNMERVGQLGRRTDDVIELGSCDEGIRRLADELGWRGELEKLWRDVVGEEEAERQLKSPGVAAVEDGLESDSEDEVVRMMEQLDATLEKDNAETKEAEKKESDEKEAAVSGVARYSNDHTDPESAPKDTPNEDPNSPQDQNAKPEESTPVDSQATTSSNPADPLHEASEVSKVDALAAKPPQKPEE